MVIEARKGIAANVKERVALKHESIVRVLSIAARASQEGSLKIVRRASSRPAEDRKLRVVF